MKLLQGRWLNPILKPIEEGMISTCYQQDQAEQSRTQSMEALIHPQWLAGS